MADAALYIGLVREILGDGAVTTTRFRIGASSLLDDIDAVLGGGARTPACSATRSVKGRRPSGLSTELHNASPCRNRPICQGETPKRPDKLGRPGFNSRRLVVSTSRVPRRRQNWCGSAPASRRRRAPPVEAAPQLGLLRVQGRLALAKRRHELQCTGR